MARVRARCGDGRWHVRKHGAEMAPVCAATLNGDDNDRVNTVRRWHPCAPEHGAAMAVAALTIRPDRMFADKDYGLMRRTRAARPRVVRAVAKSSGLGLP